jgi:hypothetical protein
MSGEAEARGVSHPKIFEFQDVNRKKIKTVIFSHNFKILATFIDFTGYIE